MQTIGKITEVGETKTYPRKDGNGEVNVTKIKIGDKSFTCFFGKSDLDNVKVGLEVDVTYTEKEVEYTNDEGETKHYTNYNISKMMPHLDGKTNGKIVKASDLLKGTNTINVGDKTYKVTLEEVK